MSTLSACFGCLPITSFSQNVGLVAMTKVVNRKAIATGAVIMVLAAFLPVHQCRVLSLPEAVLGGCTIMMFGNIIVSGFQMIARAGFTQRNITIAALSLAVGIGFTQVSALFGNFPELVQSVFAQNCVAVVFLVAVVANLALPKEAVTAKAAEAAPAAPSEGPALSEAAPAPATAAAAPVCAVPASAGGPAAAAVAADAADDEQASALS